MQQYKEGGKTKTLDAWGSLQGYRDVEMLCSSGPAFFFPKKSTNYFLSIFFSFFSFRTLDAWGSV
jgi:hypothetical protein